MILRYGTGEIACPTTATMLPWSSNLRSTQETLVIIMIIYQNQTILGRILKMSKEYMKQIRVWNFYFQLHRVWITGLVSAFSLLQSSHNDTHMQPKEQEGSWEKFPLVHTGCILGAETFADKDIKDSASSHAE